MNNQMMNTTNATSDTIAIFNDPSLGDTFSSFSPDTMEGKVKLFNAVNSPDHKIADCINQQITVVDVVVCVVTLSATKGVAESNPFNRDAEDRDGYRIILIDDSGESYTATSTGIYNSVKLLRSIFGTLHFDEGLTVTVKQISTKNGNTLSLSLK